MALLAAPPAHAAGGDPGQAELGFYAGLGTLDDHPLDPDEGSLWGLRFAIFLTPQWSLEASGQRLSMDADGADVDLESVRLNGLFNFRPGTRLRPFLTFGAGREQLRSFGVNEVEFGGNVGGGARWYLEERFGLRLDLRYAYTGGEGRGSAEATAGVLIVFGGVLPDADDDGVRNSRDRCPNTPAGALVNVKGCPIDTDRDEIPDGIDRCPGTPPSWPVGEDGCPLDSDGDGVADGVDRCPETPQGLPVSPTGCAYEETSPQN